MHYYEKPAATDVADHRVCLRERQQSVAQVRADLHKDSIRTNQTLFEMAGASRMCSHCTHVRRTHTISPVTGGNSDR